MNNSDEELCNPNEYVSQSVINQQAIMLETLKKAHQERLNRKMKSENYSNIGIKSSKDIEMQDFSQFSHQNPTELPLYEEDIEVERS